MRRVPRNCWLVSVGFSLLLVSILASAAEVSIEALVANPAQFDGQTVTLRGTAAAVKATTSPKGNDYTTFQVKGARGAAMRVFSWGHPAITEGAPVEVTGVFQRVKRVGRYTFYDEIEASSVKRVR